MRTPLIICFVVLINHCFGQNDSTNVNRFSIKSCATSFHVPFVGRSARISFEYKIRPYYSIEHEIGLFFDNSTGYMFRTDVKKYLKSNNDGTYMAIDVFHKYQTYSNSDTIVGVLKKYDVKKYVETLSFKYGRVITFKFGLLLDFYCGLGVKFQQNTNSLSTEDNANLPPLHDYNTNWILNKAQNRVYPNLLAGLKIGYRFK